MPSARRIFVAVGWLAFLRRPLPLVLAPHPAELRRILVPLIRSRLLLCGDPLHCDGLLFGKSLLQFGVILLPSARLGQAATLIATTARVLIRRHAAVTGPIACH